MINFLISSRLATFCLKPLIVDVRVDMTWEGRDGTARGAIPKGIMAHCTHIHYMA